MNIVQNSGGWSIGAWNAPSDAASAQLGHQRRMPLATPRPQNIKGRTGRYLTGWLWVVSPQQPLIGGGHKLDLGATTMLTQTPSSIARRNTASKGAIQVIPGTTAPKAAVDQDGNLVIPGSLPSTYPTHNNQYR